MKAVMYTDGGARGNPGPAGAGAVLFSPSGDVLGEVADYLGKATNNVAEYTAIVRGLALAQTLGVTELDVRMDSELAVKQLNGLYRVKNEALAALYLQVKRAAQAFTRITFTHVRREQNTHADRLVNNAIDAALAR